MAINQFPACDAFPSPRALQSGSKLRSHFAAMAVAELVKYAAVLVKDPVVFVDEMEQPLAREELLPFERLLLRIELAYPGCSIRIVIDGDHIRIRDRGRQHLHGNGNSGAALARLQAKLEQIFA